MPRTKPSHPAASGNVPAAGDEPLFTIGDLARDFGVTLRTLRFYESKGMLAPRRQGWTRLYTAADRARLGVIVEGKRLGLSLREIRGSLAPAGATAGTAAIRLSREEIARKIATLEAQKHEIEQALASLREYEPAQARPARRRAA